MFGKILHPSGLSPHIILTALNQRMPQFNMHILNSQLQTAKYHRRFVWFYRSHNMKSVKDFNLKYTRMRILNQTWANEVSISDLIPTSGLKPTSGPDSEFFPTFYSHFIVLSIANGPGNRLWNWLHGHWMNTMPHQKWPKQEFTE